MSAMNELVEALTDAGLTWGRPAGAGHPEIRVKNAAGQEFSIRVLKFSYFVAPEAEPTGYHVYQCLTAADVLEMVRGAVH